MPRKIYLEPHFSVADLQVFYKTNRDPIETRRWQLVFLVGQGHTLTAAATVVGINYEYAREIIKKYNHQGAEGIRNRMKGARPLRSDALLNKTQTEQLQQRLKLPPDDGDLWTGPQVARLIAKMTGRQHIWPQRGWEYLKRFGQPTTTHSNRH